MEQVFEEREIKIDEKGHGIASLQRISDWRKGIAIARYNKPTITPSYHYFLINTDFSVVFSTKCYDEKYVGEQIIRTFGGYYIVYDVKRHCERTYPGQDYETEYSYSTFVKNVIDENGRVLNSDEMKSFFSANKVKRTIDYGDGIVQCGLSFYRLDDYQHLFSLSKKVEPMNTFRNGKCIVGVVSDYRDFVVAVSNKKITNVFDAKQFFQFIKIFGIDLDRFKENRKIEAQTKIPSEATNIKVLQPTVTFEIQNYKLTLSIPYEVHGFYDDVIYDSNYGIKRFVFSPLTCYYFVNGEWEMIQDMDAKPLYDRIFELNCNMPNFIRDTELLASNISVEDVNYSLYKFECRPYGCLTKDGRFEYSFDVNNIKW